MSSLKAPELFAGIDGESARPTGWHSAAASALPTALKKPTIVSAKRSTAMPGWARETAIELAYALRRGRCREAEMAD